MIILVKGRKHAIKIDVKVLEVERYKYLEQIIEENGTIDNEMKDQVGKLEDIY